jgi:hypothetical protein
MEMDEIPNAIFDGPDSELSDRESENNWIFVNMVISITVLYK